LATTEKTPGKKGVRLRRNLFYYGKVDKTKEEGIRDQLHVD